MSERMKIDSHTKLKIVKLRKENYTMQQISNELNCSKSAVCKILKLSEITDSTDSTNNKKKPGHPRKTTVR